MFRYLIFCLFVISCSIKNQKNFIIHEKGASFITNGYNIKVLENETLTELSVSFDSNLSRVFFEIIAHDSHIDGANTSFWKFTIDDSLDSEIFHTSGRNTIPDFSDNYVGTDWYSVEIFSIEQSKCSNPIFLTVTNRYNEVSRFKIKKSTNLL